jgi:hypothetical protein
MPIDYGLNALL